MSRRKENIHFYIQNAIFAARLHQMRSDQGLSLVELAELTGMSRSFLSDLERGTKQPRLEDLQMIATVFNINIERLVPRPWDEEVEHCMRACTKLGLAASKAIGHVSRSEHSAFLVFENVQEAEAFAEAAFAVERSLSFRIAHTTPSGTAHVLYSAGWTSGLADILITKIALQAVAAMSLPEHAIDPQQISSYTEKEEAALLAIDHLRSLDVQPATSSWQKRISASTPGQSTGHRPPRPN